MACASLSLDLLGREERNGKLKRRIDGEDRMKDPIAQGLISDSRKLARAKFYEFSLYGRIIGR